MWTLSHWITREVSRMGSSISQKKKKKKDHWHFTEITLNLQIGLGTDILAILSFTIHKYRMFFHSFMSSLSCSRNVLQFSLYKPFPSLVNSQVFYSYGCYYKWNYFCSFPFYSLFMNRNTTDLCVLILQPATYQFKQLFWQSLQDFLHTYHLTSYFLIGCFLFLFLALAKRSTTTMLNGSESGHPCLVLDLKGKVFSLCCCVFFIYGFHCSDTVFFLSLLCCLFLIMKGC